MSTFNNIINKRFGRWTVSSHAGKDINGNTRWNCMCRCGNESVVLAGNLNNGSSKSCGCLQKEIVSKVFKTHGKSKTKIYRTWFRMKERCTNIKEANYSYYGGRGITVCKRWMKFENFFEDMGEPEDGLTIERIDNEKGYSKRNCRWATRAEQCRNTRRTHFITYMDETMCLTDWAIKLGMKREKLKMRIKRGWSIEKAITTP